VWALTLPLWIGITAFFEWSAPLAAPLWAVSLAVAGAALGATPLAKAGLLRAASVLILIVTTALFLADGLRLFDFLTAVLGRLPIVAPVWVLPGYVAFIGVMIAPPIAAAVIGFVEGRRGHGMMGGMLAGWFAIALALAYAAPAYTHAHPARRSVVYVHDTVLGQAWWEVGGNEPGLDLVHAATEAAQWRPVDRGALLPASVPVGRANGAFRFRRAGDRLPGPARAIGRIVPAADAPGYVDYEVVVMPQRPSLAATLHLPAGVVPVRATPIGVQRDGLWRATFVAIPPEGLTFRARIAAAATPALTSARITIGSAVLPGSTGALLAWLPQDRTDWTTYAQWVLAPEAAVEAPVEVPPTQLAPPVPVPGPPPPLS
jgi:hypothetical protein